VVIHAEFNSHYNNFIVATKRDLRIYNVETGRLSKVFSDIIDKRTNADITAFSLDDRQRKCYLGD